MAPEETVFIGIDLVGGTNPTTHAILNSRLRIKAMVNASFADVAKAVKEHSSVVCAVNAPGGPNKGLLTDPDYRQRVGLKPQDSNYSTFRVCEYELRRRGIGVHNTAHDPAQVSDLVKEGWQLYKHLREDADFVEYPRPGSRRLLETHSHAAYTVLLRCRPYPKVSIEGRLQRQLALYQEGVEVPDPLYVLQEWTHHRLLTGQLNMDDILEQHELDALVAAYLAFLVDREPHQITAVGDPAEGQIVVPTPNLQNAY